MPASPLSSTTWPSPAIARCQRRNISRFEAVIEAFGRLPAREDLRVRLGIATGLAVVGDMLGEGAAQERGRRRDAEPSRPAAGARRAEHVGH